MVTKLRVPLWEGLLICSFGILSSCKTRSYEQVSVLKESLNAANNPAKMGITGTLNWAQIRKVTKGQTAFPPWSDTYWPLAQTGIARRWLGTEKIPETPYEQVKSLKEIVNSQDPKRIASLSIAEKFDLVTSSAVLPSDDVLSELKKTSEAFEAVGSTEMKNLENRVKDLSDEHNRTQYEIRDTSALLATSEVPESERAAAQARLQTLLDQAAKIEEKIRGVYEEYNAVLKRVEKDRMPAAGDMAQSIQKLRYSWPLLTEGWTTWGKYASRFDKDWAWMGHCHGWAAAALQYEPPKNAVVVKKRGLEVVFTPGDVRGLLTKLWAEQAPRGEKFGGDRCNQEKVVKDRYGRIVDGLICYDNNSSSCTEDNGGLVIQKRNSFLSNAIPSIEFSDVKSPKTSRFANIKYKLADDQYVVEVIDMWDAVKNVLDMSRAKKRTAVLNLQTSCRDTNPLLFHLALVKLVAEKKQGFVIDRTRLSEVWNQPLYKFETTFVPLKKKDGTFSKPGEPVAAGDLNDVFKPFRSQRATSIVGVKSTVWYQLENGPLPTFSSDDESSQQDVFLYTLELDPFQNLVGGEWGLLPEAGKDAEFEGRPQSLWVGGDIPDFLWYFPKDAKPNDGSINRKVAERIYECSRSAATTQVKVDFSGETKLLPATSCVID